MITSEDAVRAVSLRMHASDPDAFAARALRAFVRTSGFDALARVLADAHVPASAVRAVEASLHDDGLVSASEAIDLLAGSGLVEEWRAAFAEAGRVERGIEDIQAMSRLGARLVTSESEEWPERLDDLGLDAPVALWVQGLNRLDELAEDSVALVGARAATAYGAQVAGDIAHDLVDDGITVVSGGSFGIDAAAHRGALVADSPDAGTVLVATAGLDRPYPHTNADLFAQVADSGLLVSEVPPGTVPSRDRFLRRNRIVAALARATVVVEAGWRSGALNAAHRAHAVGRPVGAVPGPVTSAASTGSNGLVREGVASLVTSAADVRELIG